jgi:hypothetical protein
MLHACVAINSRATRGWRANRSNKITYEPAFGPAAEMGTANGEQVPEPGGA